MNKLVKLSMVAILAVMANGAKAETSVSANGKATVKVRKGLAVEEKTNMDFATVTLGTGAGTVTVSKTGALTPSGDYSTAGTGSAGVFDITGPANQALTVSYENGVLKSTAAGATEIPVTVSGDASITTSDVGAASLTVTGELSFKGTEADADYTTEFGTPYKVTVSY